MFEVSDAAYDKFMGRYSFRLAHAFARFAGVEVGDSVLDVGAGTGALTAELERLGARTTASEPSPTFVASLRERHPGIEVHAGGAEELPFPDETFDLALAQLVVTFMRDAYAGVREMRRVVRPGGVVAVCMWDRQGMEMLAAIHRVQASFSTASPAAEARTLFRSREEIEGLFADGFDGMHTELLEVEAEYTGFDEFWQALGGGAGPAGQWIKELDDERKAEAREAIHRELGAPDGAFALRGRAWAVRATRA